MHLADDAAHKLALLVHILKDPETQKAIIFVKTRERLAELSGQLQAAGVSCAWIRGEMEQSKRIESIRKFHEGEVPFLIATDVAARGIDLPNVSHVINYDMPYGADVYVHRISAPAVPATAVAPSAWWKLTTWRWSPRSSATPKSVSSVG